MLENDLIEDGELYQKLAYHFCRMILSCSKNLAKPAMQPYEEKKPLDDVRRCENMDKFENWRDTPFFLVTAESYHVTSTSTFSPLQFFKTSIAFPVGILCITSLTVAGRATNKNYSRLSIMNYQLSLDRFHLSFHSTAL